VVQALLTEFAEPLMSTTLLLPGDEVPITDAREVEEIQSAGTGTAATATMTQIQTSAQALTSAANALERSIGTFETLIGQIDPNRGTLGLMLNDSSLYRNLSVTVRELGLLATDIRERPQRYINVHIF
jgi:flagellin-like hook-associated protein FlgL